MSNDKKKKVCREIVTIGLPLPNLLEYTADVSNDTRICLDAMKRFSKENGTETHEIKARGINVAGNHSNIVSKMIGDWVLILGSDHTFSPNTLEMLLEATRNEPYPKIVGAICAYRGHPYRWTIANYDESGQRLFPIIPVKDVDPGMVLSGEVMEVDVIGSGVTLYHRSVFETVPQPWFTYEPRRPGMPELEEILRDWDGDNTFSDWLESGNMVISDVDKIRLKEKAKGLRRLLAKFRAPNAIGFDFHICLKAKDYGIKSYVHWGVQTHHLTLKPITPLEYIHWIDSDTNNWWREVLQSGELTTERIESMKTMLGGLDEIQESTPEQLIHKYKEAKESA